MKLLSIALLLVANAFAHYSIISPRARQVVVGRGITPDFGGPGDVNGNNANIPGGSGLAKETADGHGVCGDDGRRRAYEFPKFAQIFGAQNAVPQATLVAGEAFEIQMRVTANHLGWMEVRYCDGQVDNQACFSKKLLKLAPDNKQFKTDTNIPYGPDDFVDVAGPSDFKGLPTASYRFRQTKCQNGAPAGTCCDPNEGCSDPNNNNDRWMFPRQGRGKVDGNGGEIFSAHYIAPSITCSRCTLQFTWVTQNSPDAFPETFWNCADVQIVAPGGSLPPTIPPTNPPPPTLRPTNVVTKTPSRPPTNPPVPGATPATQSPVTKAPVTVPGLPPNANRDAQFDIQLVFSGASNSQIQAFQAAAARWQEIIVKDLGTTVTFPAGTAICNQDAFTTNTLVDDLMIFVTVKQIDGSGKIQSQSGGCVFDNSGKVRVGSITFDSDDANDLAAVGQFDMAALHEMGHVLGLGNDWEKKNLISPRTDPGTPTYIGAFGGAGQGEIQGSGRALINALTDNGQEDRRHWEGTVYRGELMSPEKAVSKPISLLTVRALQDLGYGVDLSKADSFSIRNAQDPPTGPRATRAPFTSTPTTPTRPPTVYTASPVVPTAPNGVPTISANNPSDSDRITFLQNNAGSLNNAVVVALKDPRVIPIRRTRTAEKGCEEAVDGFICVDLARNVRCVAGKVSTNFVNPFSTSNLLKACVGGFCGGTVSGTAPGGNKCVGTAAQAVAGMRAGNEFFLAPVGVPNANRLLQDPEYFMPDTSVSDDPSDWHTPWKGVPLTNVVADPKTPSEQVTSNAGAIAGGIIGTLVVVGAVAFVAMRRRSASTESSHPRPMTAQNPMFNSAGSANYPVASYPQYNQNHNAYPGGYSGGGHPAMAPYNGGGYNY